jgi:hypothetical protein
MRELRISAGRTAYRCLEDVNGGCLLLPWWELVSAVPLDHMKLLGPRQTVLVRFWMAL